MDAYATLSEADAYHASRPSAPVWAALSDEDKRKRLTAASDYIDAAYRFKYRKTDPMQPRQFPRRGMTRIPPEVVAATAEIAADSGSLNSGIGTVAEMQRSRVKVGELEVQYDTANAAALAAARRFPLVDGWLADWIADGRGFGAIVVSGGVSGCLNGRDFGL